MQGHQLSPSHLHIFGGVFVGVLLYPIKTPGIGFSSKMWQLMSSPSPRKLPFPDELCVHFFSLSLIGRVRVDRSCMNFTNVPCSNYFLVLGWISQITLNFFFVWCISLSIYYVSKVGNLSEVPTSQIWTKGSQGCLQGGCL